MFFVCKSNNADNVYQVRGSSEDDLISRALHAHFRKPCVCRGNTGNVCCFSSVMHLYENRVVEKVACTNKALLGCFKTLAFPANTSACTLLIESVYLMPRNMSRSRRYCV